MHRRVSRFRFAAGLALAVAIPAGAQLPANFVAKDIGELGIEGSTRVENGVFTMRASGWDIWGSADAFQYAYQEVRGDGSISARVLSVDGGDPTWHKAGPMIRENDAAGAANSYLSITTTRGVRWQWRPEADDSSYGEEGDIYPRQLPLYLRVQRVGTDTSGFVSTDGQLWRQVTAPLALPLQDTALFGLAVTSHLDDEITTARFDNVAVQPGEVSIYGADAHAGDRSVLLTWRPVRGAVGYHVYRGASDATVDTLARLTAEPITTASYTDTAEALTNGSEVTYVVTPVFPAAEGATRESLRLALRATPSALPAGFVASGVNVGALGAVALFDAASGEITIRAAGSEFASSGRRADQFFFLQQPVEGNVQITVRAMTRPSGPHTLAKAGLMLRESLDAAARHATIHVTTSSGLRTGAREVAGEGTSSTEVLGNADLSVPVLLRITRRGDTVTTEYSTDNGATFQEGSVVEFEETLPNRVHVGIAAASRDGGRLSEAKFSGLTVTKL